MSKKPPKPLHRPSKWALLAVAILFLFSGLCSTAQARYLEPDPVGLQGAVNPWSNPFTYAGNNTYKYTDRLGLQAVPGGMDFGMGPTFGAITGAPGTAGSAYLLANQALLTQDPLQDIHDTQMLQAAMLLAAIPLPEFALEEAGLAAGGAAAAGGAEQCAAANVGAQIFVNSAGNASVTINGVELSIHAATRAAGRNISLDEISAALSEGHPFSYVQNGETLTGYYNPQSNLFVGVGNRITTVIKPSNPSNYLYNLIGRSGQ